MAIDSQCAEIMQFIDEKISIGANKKINGCEHSIVIDRLSSPWSLAVTAANVSDSKAGLLVIDRLKRKVFRLGVITADHG